MTEVRFYHLKAHRDNGKLFLACKLAETAVKRGHKVFMCCESEAQCKFLDTYLWSFSWSSFVPHADDEVAQEEPDKYPVLISDEDPPVELNDVMVLLRDDVPDFANQFKIVADPVDFGDRESDEVVQREEQYIAITNSQPEHFHV